jgi:hypothetical protein
MDISKLPRMSETGKHAPPPAPPHDRKGEDVAVERVYRREDVHSTGAEAWISIAVGVILILLAPRIWQYVLSRLFGTAFTWTFSDAQGNPLPYTQSVFFWGDFAMALFAIVLIVEGIIVGFTRRPAFVVLALGLTVLTTLLNLGYMVWMIQGGYGLQIMSAFAVAFGVYIAIYQKRMLALLR